MILYQYTEGNGMSNNDDDDDGGDHFNKLLVEYLKPEFMTIK